MSDVNILVYETECQLCRKQLKFAALNIPVVGQPGKQELEYLTKLVKHIAKHHKAEYAEGLKRFQMFQTFMILSQYKTNDPAVNATYETWRAQVFAMVRKNSLTDASLLHIVSMFGLKKEDQDKVYDAVKQIRDACCEFGSYAANGQTTAPSPLVSV